MGAGLAVMVVVLLPARHKAGVMLTAFSAFVYHRIQPSSCCYRNHLTEFLQPVKQLLTSLFPMRARVFKEEGTAWTSKLEGWGFGRIRGPKELSHFGHQL